MRRPVQLTAEGERGHRRGVVLGLTMAELLLLLLFCLLLASAGVLSRKDERLADASRRLADAEQQIEILTRGATTQGDVAIELIELRRQVEQLTQLIPEGLVDAVAPIPSEAWRELVLVKEYSDALSQSGLSPEALTDPTLIEATVKLVELSAAEGLSPLELVAAVSNDKTGIHDWPPIITLGNDEFRFPLNSAEISPEFRTRLQTTVIDQVLDLLDRYEVDVIEVVGHTDEQPIRNTQNSTLDEYAVRVLTGRSPISVLVPADNAGLGLARAIAVANEIQAANLPGAVRVIPLSAAQLLLPGDVLSTGIDAEDNSDRRRIEIRVRRSAAAAPS